MPETIAAYSADPFSYREARELAEALEVSDPVAITLVRRGYRTPEEARAFLAADESHPAQAFRSMVDAVARLLAAAGAGERITVHGDFDVDGVCATAILVRALRDLGADCDWMIPDRIADGYGLSAANVERLAQRGTKLLVTVDCGITAVEEVTLARSFGIDVIVTDHHQPGDQLPDCPILHPSLSGYPFEHLCGTAVAWKLVCALRAASGEGPSGATSRRVPADPAPDASRELDLVALATVADLVPLVGENRAIVRRGLEEIQRARRPGMKALLASAGCEGGEVDEGDLSFKLAPRINAAGRLYRADAGVELFLTEDPRRAAEIATELGRANGERRATERRVDGEAEAARRALPESLREARGLVVAGEGWHPGVIGIVASRLVERHDRPVVVVTLDGDGGARGSGRSIPGFDLLAALRACSEHLVSFGGHRAAAGLELRAEDLDSFREAFAAHANAILGGQDPVRSERIDAMVGGEALGLELAEELQRLAPFGIGNPGVRLLVPSARVRGVRPIGEGKHARFKLHSGAHSAVGVAFGRSRLGVGEEAPVDACVRLEVNRWNGSIEPRVVLREIYPHEEEGEAEEADAWWARFEAELQAPLTPAPSLPEEEVGPASRPRRRTLRPRSSPAALLAELGACRDGSVLAHVADVETRRGFARHGAELADAGAFERTPDLAAGFAHVVLVDPPSSPQVERAAAVAGEEGGYLHLAWGELECRSATAALERRFARRPALAALFRDLRESGEAGDEELLAALRGEGAGRRSPEAAARGFRVLSELGLVQGDPGRRGAGVRAVSSERKDLERSAAYRAYGARFQEGLAFLERRRHP